MSTLRVLTDLCAMKQKVKLKFVFAVIVHKVLVVKDFGRK